VGDAEVLRLSMMLLVGLENPLLSDLDVRHLVRMDPASTHSALCKCLNSFCYLLLIFVICF